MSFCHHNEPFFLRKQLDVYSLQMYRVKTDLFKMESIYYFTVFTHVGLTVFTYITILSAASQYVVINW